MAGLQALRDATAKLDQLLSQKPGRAAQTKSANEVQKLTKTILTGLQQDDRVFDGATEDAVQQISGVLAKVIAPVLMDVDQDDSEENDDYDDDEEASGTTKAFRNVIQRCLTVSPTAVPALALLAKKAPPKFIGGNEDIILTLAAFTELFQPWVPSTEICEQATQLLLDLLAANNTTREQFIVDTILQRYLRKLFSKSKPASITASGRKAEYVDPAAGRGEGIPDDSNETKPWKFSDFRAIALARWAVTQADDNLISKHWPLFIPVLLTLADDSTTRVRYQGLKILTIFLQKFPNKTLHDTGLSKVFEDAVFPTLSFLPSLTSEADSIQLLVPAFEALRCLASKQLLPPTTSGTSSTTENTPTNSQQIKLLDKLLREGIFSAYLHSKDHIRIVQVLCEQIISILNQMGIYAVKHLKDLIPILSSILSDPFAPAAPETLLSAIKALQAVLTNCWPRIPESPWQDEIIQAAMLCWLNANEHTFPPTKNSPSPKAAIKQELRTTVKYLDAILMAENIHLSELVKPLIAKEPSLSELFAPSTLQVTTKKSGVSTTKQTPEPEQNPDLRPRTQQAGHDNP
ncbi:hypothetical protein B0T16DRAFT_411522 [Cercophora newfieldiana]|uniref:ARM repeat superfamily protein n=1 Tax=Cercophora newfieldiana TaxID=92897 RepID=A0AA40CQI8_9PEZI|nr:hypothetical protein B0T16DRAFT_411522 [Cercophora newfieldiana]